MLALGDLGSYHTELSVEVFRGFALTDEFAPFVVINPRDSAAARCFTLLHELVHLWISEPGISGGDPLDPVEVFCNNVASNFLLPDEELATLRVPGNEGVEGWTKAIRALAEPRNVSSSMVADRLYRRAVIDREVWLGLRGLFRSRWLESRERQRRQREGRDGGPPYGVLVRQSLGPALLSCFATDGLGGSHHHQGRASTGCQPAQCAHDLRGRVIPSASTVESALPA